MTKTEITTQVNSLSGENIELQIIADNSKATIKEENAETARENGEAIIQLLEGSYYEYKLTDGYSFQKLNNIIQPSKFYKFNGKICTGIFVGTLCLTIEDNNGKKAAEIELEVRSSKTTYRQDYRYMLEFIAEKSVDLLMLYSSPVTQSFTYNFEKDPATLYQRFAFVRTIIESDIFIEAVDRIIADPVSQWSKIEKNVDMRRMGRLKSNHLKQIAASPNRVKLPADNYLVKNNIIRSVPTKITVFEKTETVDTPENRFIKHVLKVFTAFCSEIKEKMILGNSNKRNLKEVTLLEEKLNQILDHNLFKQITPPETLPLNSPVLQRKEGYREILRVWLLFDLAAKLIWQGGEDIYEAGKRDVAKLYEYWLFFKLVDILKDIFDINYDSLEKLIIPSKDGLSLKLKSGRNTILKGIYENSIRNLEIEFSYNKTFSGLKKYPDAGSWTKSMNPDYTLTFWPKGIEKNEAEKQEIIVHIHFDAKYKVENIHEILGENDINLEEEKSEQRKGNYKRADLLKMHAYKDAIRRTAGAYILYPGKDNTEPMRGFHEIIPGLGAFTVRPSNDDDGTEYLRDFISKIVIHLRNRLSQREVYSFRRFKIHKLESDKKINQKIPDYKKDKERLSPADEIFIIVAYRKDEHSKIIKKGYYNFRMGSGQGSLPINIKTTDADYILLHGQNELVTNKLYKIKRKSPRIFDKNDVIKKGYSSPSHDYYLVYDIEPEPCADFGSIKWDIRRLKQYHGNRQSASPFAVSLAELMKAQVFDEKK